MTQVIADISISLDGFVTGPNASPDNGLGDGAEALHAWAFSDDPDDQRVLREGTERSGAVIMGRRLFDVVDGPRGWNEQVGYGAGEVGTPPFVVVTAEPPESIRLEHLDWTFSRTIADAVSVARERAETASAERGAQLDVVIMGGGAVIASALAAGLVDTLAVHLAPVVLGSGTPLFTGGAAIELQQRSVIATTTAAHITYSVARA